MTDYNKDINPGMVSMLDQTSTMMENISVLVGQYYKSLRENGIPAKLAYVLVEDYHKRLVLGEQK